MGGRSAKAVRLLAENGFTRAQNLKGGILEWIDRLIRLRRALLSACGAVTHGYHAEHRASAERSDRMILCGLCALCVIRAVTSRWENPNVCSR